MSFLFRSFSVVCTGTGVYSPLRLSTYKIQFPCTPLDESTSVTFTVENIHVSSNPYTHIQPRIGSNGPVASVGPTAYEFIPINSVCSDPQSLWGSHTELNQQEQRSFLSILPCSETLNPGEVCENVFHLGRFHFAIISHVQRWSRSDDYLAAQIWLVFYFFCHLYYQCKVCKSEIWIY